MFRDYSIELVPSDRRAVDTAIARLEPGTIVTLTWIPGSNPMDMIHPAARMRRAGLRVMPHVGARHLESRAQLEHLAERLVGEAGVQRVLVIAGDRSKPAGPFDCSLAVLQTGVFQSLGVLHVAVAGFPEGNPHSTGKALEDALVAKLNFARTEGLQLSIVTQFCFTSGPIITWLKRIRAIGIDAPVRIGLAGPAGLMTLLRFAVRCGIGNSVHVLRENPKFARALVDEGPASIIRELSSFFPDGNHEHMGIAGLHFYPFGGVGKTLDWISRARTRKLEWAQP